MKKKVLSLVFCAALTAGLLAGCGSSDTEEEVSTASSDTSAESEESSDRPLEGEHLIFGINATFAPFEYVEGTDEDGEEILAGLDIDLVAEFAEILGFTYEFSDMEFNALTGAITSGRCDVIVSGITINDERDEVTDASDGYFSPRIAILSYEDAEYEDVESLDGKSVGVSLGTVYEYICEDTGYIDTKTYDSTAVAFQDLANGNLDACMFDATQAQNFVEDNPDLGLVTNIMPYSYNEEYQVQEYVVLVPEGETELLSCFNDAIDQLQEDGTLDELIIKWCGEEFLTAE